MPLKYYLSAKACAGVLRRAEKRGKALDPVLRTALEQQIERWEKFGSPLPIAELNVTDVLSVDNHAQDGRYTLHGNKVQTLSAKMGKGGDNVPYVLYTYVGNSSGNDVSGTIDAHYYLGCGARGGKEREFVAIALDRSAYNQGKNAKYDIGVDHEGIAFTVTAKGPGAVCYCLQGNGIDRADTAGCNGKGWTENVSNTLNTVDRHAVCYPEKHDYCVRIREGKDGGGKGALVQTDKSGTLGCGNDQIVFHNIETQYVVRRLTPLECCRLQGMPDWWTEGVSGSDAARYKMWGNGMALPNALYVMEGFYG